MKIIGVILVIVGVLGLLLSSMMFGDIGVVASIGSIVSLLSGIGFILAEKKFNSLKH